MQRPHQFIAVYNERQISCQDHAQAKMLFIER